MAQSRKECLGWKILMKTHSLMNNLLDTDRLLQKYDEQAYFGHRELDPFVRTLRSRLSEAVRNRVFRRYEGASGSQQHCLIFDQQVFMNPIFKDMRYLTGLQNVYKDVYRPEDISRRIEAVKARVRGLVQELAINVSSVITREPQEALYPGAVPQVSPLDSFSSSMTEMIREYGDVGAMDVADGNLNETSVSAFFQAASIEMSLYQGDQGIVSLANDPLQWWYQKRNDYPILSKCARIIYSVPAGAGAMELDIGHTGMIATKSRTSLAGDLVEAMTILNRNRDMVDLVNIDSCTADELIEKLPQRITLDTTNENSTVFGSLDVHFPDSFHEEVSEMMDLISQDNNE